MNVHRKNYTSIFNEINLLVVIHLLVIFNLILDIWIARSAIYMCMYRCWHLEIVKMTSHCYLTQLCIDVYEAWHVCLRSVCWHWLVWINHCSLCACVNCSLRAAINFNNISISSCYSFVFHCAAIVKNSCMNRILSSY